MGAHCLLRILADSRGIHECFCFDGENFNDGNFAINEKYYKQNITFNLAKRACNIDMPELVPQ